MTYGQAIDMLIDAINSKPPKATDNPFRDIAAYERWEDRRNDQFRKAMDTIQKLHDASGSNDAMVIEMSAADNDDDDEVTR